MSPLKTIPKSQEPTQPNISESQDQTRPEVSSHVFDPPHVSESVPHTESPFRSTHESQDPTQPETSSYVSESIPQPTTESQDESKPQSKESPSKTIPKPQEITQLKTPPHVSESVPHLKESPSRSTPISQDVTQPETSSHVSELVPQPKTESNVFESKPQAKESPSKTIPKSQEITKSEIPSQVDESVPQLKESPSKTSPKSKEQTQLRISSHESVQKTEVKESPPKTSPHVSKPMPQQKMSPFKIVSTPEEPIQPKTSPQHKRTSSESGTQTAGSSGVVIREERKKQDTRESIEGKVMSASNSTGKDTKVVSSIYPANKNVSIPSHQEDISPIGEKTPLKEGIIEDISKFVQKLAMGQPEDTMEDKSIRAITLAGENRGATMHMGSVSTKKEGAVHIHQDYRTDSKESPEVTTESDREEGSGNSLVEPDEVGNAHVNSNIQSINNSLMFQGSVTEKDPGVQLILPRRPAESIKFDDEDSKG
ncbi:hypothetical protein K1719_029711 [Acacia pycnantha]|nr:hypothetical protein K1719_029711 [Acacia pycnantha]